MSRSFIDLIRKIIHSRYYLKPGRNNSWILKESHREVKIRTPDEHSIAFSLDHETKPFAFFSNHPPTGFNKVCDAIFFCCYRNRTYLFIIEVKTRSKKGYEKQLINGKLFCDWLIALCIEHESLDPSAVVIPLLIWKPRQNPVYKGTTTHHEDSNAIEKMKLSQLDGIGFEIKHYDTVTIVELISRLEEA